MDLELLPGETAFDVSHLKVKGIATRSQLNALEAKNVLKAMSKYFGRRRPTNRMAPFDLPWIKRLHEQMFGDVWKWAGKTRLEDLNIGVKWYLIDQDLQNLLSDLKYWEASGTDLLECAARLHHKAVAIHPFYNGNGRWARMLANIFLRTRNQPETKWPEDLLGTASTIRGDYLTAIKAADVGNSDLLLALHRRLTSV